MGTTTTNPVIVRQRTAADGTTGWEAVTVAAITTTHTVGMRETADQVVTIVRRMMDMGMMPVRQITVVW